MGVLFLNGCGSGWKTVVRGENRNSCAGLRSGDSRETVKVGVECRGQLVTGVSCCENFVGVGRGLFCSLSGGGGSTPGSARICLRCNLCS